jgi:hypothetical protein
MPDTATVDSSPRVRTLTRWRAGLAVATVLAPLAFYALAERHARRLDALADHGAAGEATVTGADGPNTAYAYQVNGATYTWSVKRAEAPFAAGERFAITYLPEDPSLNLPVADRALAAPRAAENRSFRTKFTVGVGALLALLTVGVDRDLRRLRRGVAAEPVTVAQYRRRLVVTGLAMVPPVGAIVAFHARDASQRGESLVPVVLSALLVAVLLIGTGFTVARQGPEHARERAAKLMGKLWPVMVVVAVLRLLAMVFGLDGSR